GGDGGHGGSVVLVGDEGLNTLHAFRFTKRYEGGRGGHGEGSNRQGKRGEMLRIKVPVGTLVRDAATGELVADITAHGQEAVVARGGRGGRGNASFRSSTNQAPRVAELGEPGQERRLHLELKLLADVGLVGLPNAGKSTLLAAVSAARPKVADYPFTTLVPSLGVADIGYKTLVFADIPGLIEGASEGAGLGDRFLRHVERTRVLLHLVDGSAADPLADWRTINAELAAFSPALAERPQIVAITKLDLPAVRDALTELLAALTAAGCTDAMAISGLTGEGIPELLARCAERVAALPAPQPVAAEIPVLRPLAVDEDAFTVERDEDGVWQVDGIRLARTIAMTNWENGDAVERLQRILQAMGVLGALRDRGVAEGDTVRLSTVELEWTD
ncbi:MAG TPA: GTPase ObgE, partial [Gemmatimonadales bacterium]|nr:GTPase ObgE [Gemmatimonadales bacterium]